MVANYTYGISPALPAKSVFSTWLPLKSEQPEFPGPGCPMKLNSLLGYFLPLGLNNTPTKDWKKYSLQSWGLQCLGKVPPWQASTSQGCSESASNIHLHFVME